MDFKIIRSGKVTIADNKQLIEICEKFEGAGEEIRLSKNDIPNMTIVDGESVFINTDDKLTPNQTQADIIMRRTTFAKYMNDLFDFYWDKSYRIKEYKK